MSWIYQFQMTEYSSQVEMTPEMDVRNLMLRSAKPDHPTAMSLCAYPAASELSPASFLNGVAHQRQSLVFEARVDLTPSFRSCVPAAITTVLHDSLRGCSSD